MSSQIRGSISWALVATIATAGGHFLVLSALAWGGGARAIGEYVFALAFTSPWFVLSCLNLRSLLVTDPARLRPVQTYHGLRTWGMLGLMMVVLIGGVVGHDQDQYMLLLAMGVARIPEGMADLAVALAYRSEQVRFAARSETLRAVLIPLAIYGTLSWGAPVSGAIWCKGAVSLLIYVLHDRHYAVRLDPQIRPWRIWLPTCDCALLKQAMPLGLAAASVTLLVHIPYYLLGRIHGGEALGIYAPLAYLYQIGNLGVLALVRGSAARMAVLWQSQEGSGFLQLWRRVMGMVAWVGIGSVLVATTVGGPILGTLLGVVHPDARFLFLILGVASVCTWLASVAMSGLTIGRRVGTQMTVTVVAVALNATGAILWIPEHGARGAAQAQMVGGIALLIGASLALWMMFRRRDGKATRPWT